MIIGITGKSGSGKTFYSKELNKNNEYLVINVDKLTHKILKEQNVKEELILKYNTNILTNNKIDTKKLGHIVFSSKNSIKEYNEIIWKYIKLKIQQKINKTNKDIIIDWSLLPLSSFFNECKVKVLFSMNLQERENRVIKRDKITKEYFLKREKQSLKYNIKEYDIIINTNNPSNIEEIIKLIERRKKA